MRDSDRGTILDSEGPDILRSSLLNSGSLPPHSFQDQNARKILVVGFTGTGKSSFVIKSLYDFTDLEGIGNEEIHFGRFEYKKKDYNLQIVDVASLDNYTPLLPTKYTLKVDGYVFVYAVDDEATFQFIQVLKDRLYNLSGKMIPAVLVANKCDRTATRAVTTKQGSKLAKGYKIPYFEISATQNSKEVTRKVFEGILKEILKSEAQINTLKWLKNWERSRVDDLRKIFFLALILTGIIGLFCFSFPIINMFLYPTLMQVQGIVLILLISEGIISIALSIIGWIGMQKEKDDYIRAFTVLVVFSTAIDIALIVLKIAHPVPSVEQLKSDNPEAGAEYNLLDPVVFVVLAMIWAVMVFLFVIARLSKEIFLKRRNANKSKFATLRV